MTHYMIRLCLLNYAELYELRYVSINQADSISAENLQYNGKNEEGQHILASEEVQVLDMQI